jgi:hypothetical protein
MKPKKINKKLKPFDIYRSVTGHDRIPESTNMCQGQNCKFVKLLLELHIIVVGLSQNTEFLLWSYFVSLERTRPNDVEECTGANHMLMV